MTDVSYGGGAARANPAAEELQAMAPAAIPAGETLARGVPVEWAMVDPWKVVPVPFPRDVVGVLERLSAPAAARRAGPSPATELVWLDGGCGASGGWGRAGLSLIGLEPAAVIEQHDGVDATLSIGGRVAARDADGLRLWCATARRVPVHAPPPIRPAPGWVGFVGYEMAGRLERLPRSHRADLGLPLMRMALLDRVFVVDHARRGAWCVASDLPREVLGLPGAALQSDVARWVEACAQAEPAAAADRPSAPRAACRDRQACAAEGGGRPRVGVAIGAAEFGRAVERALAYIAAGDAYQINLAHRITVGGLGDPLSVHAALRAGNPAPFSALLAWDDAAVVSASPELFLRLRGRDVLTRPIKGTRPRTGDAVLDAAYRAALLDSGKDAAELTMIVDLHRNDLGRVCAFGSVRVPRARVCEAHPRVFHTLADVTGRLRAGLDAFDLLAACFPAGSVTGVPKVRAMQIIDELEWCARGAYTGAIGSVGLDGDLTMSVAIRTLQMRGGRAALHVGGGIVADSDPAEEYQETLAKARGIVEALGAAGFCGVADGGALCRTS